MPLTQSTRIAIAHTPAGADVLVCKSVAAHEALSQLSRIEVELLSEKPDTKPDALLGQGVTIEIASPSEQTRFFHGLVSRCGISKRDARGVTYHLELVPWLWILTRTSDCRVFQKMTVPDIIMKVFRDHGFNDFEPRLQGSYDPWEYCVQYRETDFNFVSRLMEEEGIYYFFKHEMGKHTLVLCDGPGSHDPTPGYDKISWRPGGLHGEGDEHIRDWVKEQQLQPGKYAHTDYNFETPKTGLLTTSQMPGKHAQAEMEVYDYPGEYSKQGEGSAWAKIRMEELHSRHKTATGFGDSYGVCTGAKFKYIEALYPADEGEYLVVSTSLNLEAAAYETGDEGSEVFSCSFTVIPAEEVYRPARSSVKPLIHGVQTAVVVGPAGEEIFTDKYGRIKVQFHWDREGKKDENSSCWMRVATPWAGRNFGAIHIPRIGQEVVVAFLEGDPDQPLVIGSVYNADQMPPWELPGNKTQSGIQTRSSLGGGREHYNELCFEDKKGNELVYLRAEKDYTIAVENDEAHWVGHDRVKTIDHDETTHVKHDRTETVDNNETITIVGNRTEKVMKNEEITIMGKRTEKVIQGEDITIAASRTKKVGASETITIGGTRSTTVGGSDSTTVGGARTATIGGANSTTVGAANSTTAGAALTETAGAAISMTAGGAVVITASAIVLNAPAVTINSAACVISGRLVKPIFPPIIP
jgi:type VI secretion system secreted protein VgrG